MIAYTGPQPIQVLYTLMALLESHLKDGGSPTPTALVQPMMG